MANPEKNRVKGDIGEKIKAIIPLAINDGREAIKYIRTQAAEFGISPPVSGSLVFLPVLLN